MARLAFTGPGARILWAGSTQFLAQEYFESLNKEEKARTEALFRRMADAGEIRNELKYHHEGDQIYCFKPGKHRFASFRDGRDIVVTHGFKKQRGKMPKKDLARAKEARRRHMEGL